jgi:hypothetical protein
VADDRAIRAVAAEVVQKRGQVRTGQMRMHRGSVS